MSRTFRSLAAAYLGVQALGIIAWWVWLAGSADARIKFAPVGSDHALIAFAGGDLLILAALACIAAVGLFRGAVWAGPLLWFHAGAAGYASCWAFSLAMLEPSRAIGALMMAPLLVAAIVIAAAWSRSVHRRSAGA